MLKQRSITASVLSSFFHSNGPSSLSSVQAGEREGTVPSNARVVICGGGVMGASVAYHLAELGWGKDTIVIDKGRCGSGTEWLSSGLIGTYKPKLSQVKLTQSTIQLYKDLEAKGLNTGWKQCGSLCLARTRDRYTVFRRMKSKSVSWNLPCELVTPDEIKKMCPLLRTDDLHAGLWLPNDGVADGHLVCKALLDSAKQKGVTLVEDTALSKVLSERGRVSGVVTRGGQRINCEVFVNCAGFWAREVGHMSHPVVKVPIHACQHYYLHTQPMPELDPMCPAVRDLDGHVYIRENDGKLLCGGFEPSAKPAFEDGVLPETPEQRQLPADWDQFHCLLEPLLHRVPSLKDAVLLKLCNGPETFTPDNKWIVGEAPELRNYFVASGMKAVGISSAGGVGEATARWIVDGFTSYEMYDLDITRFLGLHNTRRFLRDRVQETPGMHYGLLYPFREYETGRNLRLSPIYPRLREAGAVFGQVMGYERPTYFDPDDPDRCPDGSRPYRIARTDTFGKPDWFDLVANEYNVCREAVGLSDYSSFTKIELWSKGREVVDALQYLCSNDVDVPLGTIIHTGMQNQHGGYENDCSLIRMSENKYFMIAPTIQQTRCKVWMARHLPPEVVLSDVTSMYTAICLMGPFTAPLLSELTDEPLDPKSFPFFTYKELDVASAHGIRALNITHTGELGFVLYIPNEFALHVYQHLITAGEKYGLQHAGYYAMRALRVEKFFAFWGQDIDTTTTPLECGRTWRVKFNKSIDFLGRDALLKQRDEGVKRMYVQLILTDHDHEVELWSWGGEPIYRDGHYVGATTTTGYGYTFKKQVCLGFVRNIDDNGVAQRVTNEWVLGGHYEVDIAGIRHSAKVNLHSPILPSKYRDNDRETYRATRDKAPAESILEAV